MNIPTCAVRAVVHTSVGGAPVIGARVTAELSNYEIYQGFVVPRQVMGITGLNGEVILDLFPNELGSVSSFYDIKIQAPLGGTFRSTAVIPNLPSCDLSDYTETPVYDGKPDGLVILSQMQALRTQAAASATAAAGSASAASASAATATTKAAEAATSAQEAQGEASAAQMSAIAADESEAASAASAAAAAESAAVFDQVQADFIVLTTAVETQQTTFLGFIANLASSATAAFGAGMVAFNEARDYVAGSIGKALKDFKAAAVQKSELAAPTGAGGVGTRSAAPLAVPDTVNGALSRTVSVQDFMTEAQRVDCQTPAPLLDHTAAIQNFWDYINTKNVGVADFSGNFRITSKVRCFGAVTPVIRGNATIFADFAAEDEVVTFDSVAAVSFPGKITIVCGGSAIWTTRTNGIGAKFVNSGRASLDFLEVRFAKYHATQFVAGSNSSLVLIKAFRSVYCGSAQGAQGKTVNFTARANTGSVGSVGQRTTLTLTEAPLLLNHAKFAVISNYPYAIMGVDIGAGTIDVYPWVDSAVLTGAVQIIGGAGQYVAGGDNSMINTGSFDAFVCGIGYQGDNLYPGQIGTFTSQLCGVAHTLGVPPGGGCVGGATDVAYFEGNLFDVVVCTSSPLLSYKFGSTSALQLSKCIRLAPRLAADVLHPAYTSFTGVEVGRNGRLLTAPTYFYPGSSSVEATPLPAPVAMTYSNGNNAPTIRLLAPQTGSAYPYQDTFFMTTGSGPNGAPTGTVTITPEASCGINGGVAGVSATYTGLPGATLWHAFFNAATSNWVVNRVALGNVLTGSLVYNPPSIATGAKTSVDVTIAGASFGDIVSAPSFSLDTQGIELSARISAANTVTVTFRNDTGAAIDLASGTVRLRVSKT